MLGHGVWQFRTAPASNESRKSLWPWSLCESCPLLLPLTSPSPSPPSLNNFLDVGSSLFPCCKAET